MKTFRKGKCIVLALILLVVTGINIFSVVNFNNEFYIASASSIVPNFRILNGYTSKVDYNNMIIKVSSIEEYSRLLKDTVGSIETSFKETPRAVAFMTIGESKIAFKIESDAELTDDDLVEKAQTTYVDNMNSNQIAQKALDGYVGYDFDFGTGWKTYGVWAIEDPYILNGQLTPFGGNKELAYLYEQNMTLYYSGQAGRFFAQLQILSIVWKDPSMSGVSLTYNNSKYSETIMPFSYDEYAPKASVGNSNSGFSVNYGVGSDGKISFGGGLSMSQSKSDCNVIDRSDKFAGNISLTYEFGGTYSKSTMYLNSFVIAKMDANNYLDNVGIHRDVSFVVQSSSLFNIDYKWNVFSKENILFAPSV